MNKLTGIILLTISMLAITHAQDIRRMDGRDFYVYTVETGEGLLAIAKRFNVTPYEIADFNPQLTNGLKAGQTLLIPIKTAEHAKTVDAGYIEHKVEKKQTLFAISQLYGISQSEIAALNPSVADGLKKDQILKIPVKQNVISETKPAAKPETKTDTGAYKPDNWLNVISDLFAPQTKSADSAQNIVFLLPFMLDNTNPDGSNRRFVEFYAGALMATEYAKKQGLGCSIYTFDTGRNENKIKEILALPELQKADLIIGPAYSNQVSFIAEFVKVHKINTLIPFSPNVPGLDTNPYIFQFNPSLETEVNFTAQILDAELKNANIIFINLQNTNMPDDGEKYALALLQKLKSIKREYTQINADTDDFDFSKFDSHKKNIVIFDTDKYSAVHTYFDVLDALAKDCEISVYAQYGWQMPEGKRFKYFNITPFKQYYLDFEIRNHQSAFEHNFGWKPLTEKPAYSLLGYDLVRLFITEMKNDFQTRNSFYTEGLQSSPNFERDNAMSGFMNKKLYFNEK